MLLIQQVKSILLRNNNLRRFKDDQTVHSLCIRVMNMFIGYGFYNLDERGNILGSKFQKLESLSNFELLHLIESIISSNDKLLIDPFLVKSIQSIDYIGQCWYYPKELSIKIFESNGEKHNYKKVRTILNNLVNENICLKITNKKRQSMYRILYTYQNSK